MYEQIRLLTWIFIQEVMFFIFHKILLYILFKFNLYNFPLENVEESPPCTLEQQPLNAADAHLIDKGDTTVKSNHPIPVHTEPKHLPLYTIPCIVRFLIDISLLFCLPSLILCPKIIPCISQHLMGRMELLPKNISRLLKII